MHFIPQIYDFGAASNITGRIGESNLKEKAKRPSERTRMQAQDFEYCTAVKDIENCVIHKAVCEVVDNDYSILTDILPELQKINDDKGSHILGAR